VALSEPRVHVAESDVIGEPPVGPAATVSEAPFDTAVVAVMVGACGAVAGHELIGVDGRDAPAELRALTVHVYEVPLARPVTVSGLEGPDALCVATPGPSQVTVYPLTGEAPEMFGARNVAVSEPSEGTSDSKVGRDGTPVGVTLKLAPAGPVPATLIDAGTHE